MAVVHEPPVSRVGPVQQFLKQFQYTISFLMACPTGDMVVQKKVQELFSTIKHFLATGQFVAVYRKNRRFFLNDQPLHDSYILQRIFGEGPCPGVCFLPGLEAEELAACLRELVEAAEGKKELVAGKKDFNRHFQWIGPENPLVKA